MIEIILIVFSISLFILHSFSILKNRKLYKFLKNGGVIIGRRKSILFILIFILLVFYILTTIISFIIFGRSPDTDGSFIKIHSFISSSFIFLTLLPHINGGVFLNEDSIFIDGKAICLNEVKVVKVHKELKSPILEVMVNEKGVRVVKLTGDQSQITKTFERLT